MLTAEQLGVILSKKELKLEDIFLLEDHLLSIQRLEDEYVELPIDVCKNLNNDVELIVKFLKNYREKTDKPKLVLLKNDQ